jgi:integrase
MNGPALSMKKLVQRYLEHRRSFGYRLYAEGYDLRAFARFLDRTAPGEPLNTKLALQLLHVPAVKRSPGRTLPLHPSTVRALEAYQGIRRSYYPFVSHFFVGPFGRPLSMASADWTFGRLVRGIVSKGSRARPRLYDLRHRFATKWISRWSRQSVPLAHRLVLLSRYLGHKEFHDTYWYVQPESSALKKAAARFEQYQSTSG